MDTVSGYEGTATGDGNGKFLPPPAALVPGPGAVSPPSNTNWEIPSITEEVARQAFLEYASHTCCYSTEPPKEMNVQDLRSYNTYRYRLETFTESRACEWVTEPYNGQVVDSSAYGLAPQPWEIPVQVPTLFKDKKHKMPVPYTSSLKSCQSCQGMGRIMCQKCHGGGRVLCWVCNGTGRRLQSETCHNCFGNGTQSCSMCHSSSHQMCRSCSGKGRCLCYIQLNVMWKNNVFEFVADHSSDFRTELFGKVNGEKIFTDEQFLVPPLVTFPEPAINQASQNALQQHQTQFSSCRVLRQRQTIEWLPLTKVDYDWKGKTFSYFVYGKENKVYTVDYPAKCCCAVM
ncbi:hypothetical protein FKM82_004377 [Ascaphus truei]